MSISNEALYTNYGNINESIPGGFEQAYYDKTAAEYDAMYKEYMPVNKDAHILDIGCGKGFFLYYLQRQGYTNFWGIDADQVSVDHSKKYVSEKIIQTFAKKFLIGKKNEYDLIVMNEVLEHIPKDEIIPLLTVILNSIRPGGKLICYVPNMENPFTMYTRYHDFTHTIGFTQNSLRMVLKAAGFNNIQVIAPQGNKKGIKKFIKGKLQLVVRKILILLFEYPKNGFINSSRIFSVAVK